MKKLLILAVFCLSFLAGSSQVKKVSDIIGRWAITGENNNGAYLFVVDSSTIILNYMGETKTLIDCKMDFSKSPAWFDFSAKDSSSTVQVKSLLMQVSDDVIKWQIFIDEDRPDHFSSTKGELLYLKKLPKGGAVATN